MKKTTKENSEQFINNCIEVIHTKDHFRKKLYTGDIVTLSCASNKKEETGIIYYSIAGSSFMIFLLKNSWAVGHALQYFTIKKIGCLNDKTITISPTLFKKYLDFARNKKGEVL